MNSLSSQSFSLSLTHIPSQAVLNSLSDTHLIMLALAALMSLTEHKDDPLITELIHRTEDHCRGEPFVLEEPK